MLNSKIRAAAAVMAAAFLLTGCAQQESKKEAQLILDESQQVVSESEETTTKAAYLGSIVSDSTMKAEISYRKQMVVTGYGYENSELAEVLVSMGQTVQKGEVLARVKVSSNERKISEMQNQLSSAQQSYETGLAQYEESLTQAKSDLAASTAGTLQYQINAKAVEKAQAAYDAYVSNQSATLQSLRDALNEETRKASDTDIIAPMDGVIRGITSLKAEDKIMGDTMICAIADPASVCLCFTSSPGNGFRSGSTVDLKINGSEIVENAGKIISGPELFGQSTGEYYVDITDAFTLEEIKAINSFYIMGTSFEMDNVLLIPLKAVKQEAGSYYVKVDNNGLLSKRYLQISAMGTDPATQEEVVMVSAGLDVGETVVVYGN